MFAAGLLAFLLYFNLVYARYTLQVTAVNYNNPNNREFDGGCCDPFCGTCDLYFKFCLRNKNLSPTNSDNCWDSVRSSPEITSSNYNFPSTGELYSGANVNNPITFTENRAWTGSFQLLVEIMDSDVDPDDLIDRVAFNRDMSPTNISSGNLVANGFYNAAQFTVQITVFCQTNYYSNNCSVYCVPQNNSTNGFYTCGTQGEKICRPGYTNPNGNCLTPITACSTGCQNGSCNALNQCICNAGWTGSNCDVCIPRAGCSSSHGRCTQPNECICETGYGGLLCTEDHDVCGHQQPCLNGGTCTNIIPNGYRCTCTPQYNGTNCDQGNSEPQIDGNVGLFVGIPAAAVIALVVTCVLIFVIVLCCYCRKGQKEKNAGFYGKHDRSFTENVTYIPPDALVSPHATLQHTNAPPHMVAMRQEYDSLAPMNDRKLKPLPPAVVDDSMYETVPSKDDYM